MKRKLNCIVVDDSKIWVDILDGLCKTSRFINRVTCFDNPQFFLDASRKIQFDLLILDIHMPQIDGITVARMFEDKMIVFVTAEQHMLRSALELSVVDVLIKPITNERFDHAMEKAQKLNKVKAMNQYAFYNVAESDSKIRIKLSDIMFVRSDEADPRNKIIVLKNGQDYTLMNYTFDQLLDEAPLLVKVNRRELISVEAVDQYRHDEITVKNVKGRYMVRYVTLSDNCRKNFKEVIHSL